MTGKGFQHKKKMNTKCICRSGTGLFTDLSIREPLNFGAIDVKMYGGMKVKEANFLWNSFGIPVNYWVRPEFWVTVPIELNRLVQKSEVWLLQLCQNLMWVQKVWVSVTKMPSQ